MAICKQCGVEIPEGQELCENCIKSQSNTPNTDESYLDNLLQSISSSPQGQDNLESLQKDMDISNITDTLEDNNSAGIKGKKENTTAANSEEAGNDILEDTSLEELENNALPDINLEELESNTLGDINLEELGNDALRDINLEEMESNALEDINLEEVGNDVSEASILEETENKALGGINQEGLDNAAQESKALGKFEDKTLENFNLDKLENINSEYLDENDENRKALEDINLDNTNEIHNEQSQDISLEEAGSTLDNQNLEKMLENDLESIEQEDSENVQESPAAEENIFGANMEEQEGEEDKELDDVVGSLLNDLDSSGGVSISEAEENDEADTPEEESSLDEIEPIEQNETDPMGDVEDLLGMLASEAMEEGESKSSGTENTNEEEVKEDIFSLDNIGDIENLLEETTEEETLAKEINSVAETEEDKRKIFEELEDNGDSLESNILEDIPSQKELEKKKGIIHKLFGNIFDDKSKKSHKKMEEKEEKSLQSKEKKKEKKEAKKAAKNDPAVKAEKEAKKKAKDEKKAAAKAVKAEKKKEKEEKKKQRLAEEEEEAKKDQGRINPIGAVIIFILAGAATVFVVFGSKNFSYSKSIKEADKYFTGRDYNLAYDEVRGLDIKDKDLETYDRIITVMYVNKQLNSYDNYYSMKMYPQALDSLLKGLKKYDEYIGSAKKLGVKSDFEYLRKRILKEMKKVFKLSESQAYKIIDSNDQEIYSQKVVEVADKNKKE